jgi:hypothetical protein
MIWGWVQVFVPAKSILGLTKAFNEDMSSIASLHSALDGDLNGVINQAILNETEAINVGQILCRLEAALFN